MPEIVVEHRDGTESTLRHIKHRVKDRFGKQSQATFTTFQSDAENAGLVEAQDEVYLYVNGTREFGGILEDEVYHGAKAELLVDDFEQYAIDADPVGGNDDVVKSTDAEFIEDVVNSVDELDAGKIDTTATGLAKIFSHISQAKKAREIEKVTTADVWYGYDKTLNYDDDLGRDQTDITLSPQNQNVVENFERERRAEYERGTHVKALGSGQGNQKLVAWATSPEFEPGDRKIVRQFGDDSINSDSMLEQFAETIAEEINKEFVEVSTTVEGTDVQLGDYFHVEHPNYQLDMDMRVAEVDWIWDDDGSRYSVTLSSRSNIRYDADGEMGDHVQNAKVAMQGVSVPINNNAGLQEVGPERNYVHEFYYPDEVVDEIRLNARVMGLPYFARSAGAEAGGGEHDHPVPLGITSQNNADFTTTVASYSDQQNTSIDEYWTDIGSIQPSVPTQRLQAELSFDLIQTNTDTSVNTWVEYRLAVEDDDGVVTYQPSEVGFENKVSTMLADGTDDRFIEQRYKVSAVAPQNLADETVTFQMRLAGSAPGDFSVDGTLRWQGEGQHIHVVEGNVTSEAAVGLHEHGPKFGIMTEDAEGNQHYPQDTEVIVNGKPVGVRMGEDAQTDWTESTDITGMLRPGAINRIEATSETLGMLIVAVEGDVYRLIRGSG